MLVFWFDRFKFVQALLRGATRLIHTTKGKFRVKLLQPPFALDAHNGEIPVEACIALSHPRRRMIPFASNTSTSGALHLFNIDDVQALGVMPKLLRNASTLARGDHRPPPIRPFLITIGANSGIRSGMPHFLVRFKVEYFPIPYSGPDDPECLLCWATFPIA